MSTPFFYSEPQIDPIVTCVWIIEKKCLSFIHHDTRNSNFIVTRSGLYIFRKVLFLLNQGGMVVFPHYSSMELCVCYAAQNSWSAFQLTATPVYQTLLDCHSANWEGIRSNPCLEGFSTSTWTNAMYYIFYLATSRTWNWSNSFQLIWVSVQVTKFLFLQHLKLIFIRITQCPLTWYTSTQKMPNLDKR